MRLTRRNQLWVLIVLSAVTASLQYTLQGALATDAMVDTFPDAFWVADYAAWALRALVEAWIIVYVFTTRTTTRTQGVMLVIIEAALLALITLTLGPAFRAIGARERMYESLSHEGFWLWNYGIAAYTSVMMAAAGTAYRMQPQDDESEDGKLAALRRQLAREQEIVRAAAQGVGWLATLDGQEAARLIAASMPASKRPPPADLAAALGIHPSVVARAYREEMTHEQ